MNWKSLAIPLSLVLAILVIGTLVEARLTDRWVKMDSKQLDRFAEAIDQVPKVIGDWEGKDDAISDEEFRLTNCKNYLSRQYVNRDSGEQVTLYLVAGTARHVTIHTPDRCYRGSGFQRDGSVKSYVMDLGGVIESPEFSTAVFRKPDNEQRVFWTYSDDGHWYGPGSSNIAKVKFGGRPALFKIYLIGPPTSAEDNVANRFAKDAFPLINRILFGEDSGHGVEEEITEADLTVS